MAKSKVRKKNGRKVVRDDTKMKALLKKKASVNRPLKGKKIEITVEYTRRFKIRWWIFNRLMSIACKIVKCDAIETKFVDSKTKKRENQ